MVRLVLLLLLFGIQRYHTDIPVKNDQSLELACTMGPLLQVVNKVQHSFPQATQHILLLHSYRQCHTRMHTRMHTRTHTH